MMTRSASQVVFGKLYWSLTNLKETDANVSFPLNEPFAFYVIFLFAMLGTFSAFICDKNVEKSCNEQM